MRTSPNRLRDLVPLCALALVGCSDHRLGFFPDTDSGDGSSSATTTTGAPTMPTTVSPTTVSPTTVSPTTVSPTTDTPTVTTSGPTTTGIECGEAFIAGDLPFHLEMPMTGQGNTFATQCGGADGPDVGFIWTVPFTGRFEIDTNGSSFDTVLALLDGGCAGPELVCDDDSGDSSRSRVEVDLFQGQEVTIVVDSLDAAGELALNINEVKVDTECPDALFETVVPFGIVGQTEGAPNLRGGSCGGHESPEIEGLWTAPFDGVFRFEILEADFDPVMYLRAEDCDGPELACNDDSKGLMPAFEVLLLAGQRVILVVDGVFSAGDFSLLITEA